MKNIYFEKLSVRALMLLFAVGVSFTSCSKDDDEYDSMSSYQSSSSSSLTKPELAKNITTTTYDDLNFKARFSNGGDTYDNMTCTVYWGSYTKKQATTPKVSALTKSGSMKLYDTAKKSTTFSKSYTGLSGGTCIYYYFKCSNSKYTVNTDVTYCIIKR
ncbi:MAG: hypothetical protein Q4P84_04310 [Elusimicrobiales bacterium]|nr:hypothetical protein [Elusimicrobiales bacterium]